jgi:anhydro-N-acetylmuramic acid kinase
MLRADKKVGLFYLRSVAALLESGGGSGTSVDLVGCHGQTVHHLAGGVGKRARDSVTLQIGSPDVLAQGLGAPVVSDFRSADIAAGGRGAPLTPIAHFHIFDVSRCRQLVVNIGGISNLTYLPGDGDLSRVCATDCGPGNMLTDQICSELLGRQYDKGGAFASKGSVNGDLLSVLRSLPFLRRKLPLSLGREQFGADVVDQIILKARDIRLDRSSVISTVTYFSAYCIHRAAQPYRNIDRVLICGGGAHNIFLRDSLRELFKGIEVDDSSAAGVDPDFVESVSFALLANLMVDGIPGNLPQVTGAVKPVVLGKLTVV